MPAEQIVIITVAVVGALVGIFKLILPRFVDARKYERERAALREDKAFKMLEQSLEQRREVQTALIAQLGKLIHNIDQQTTMISQQTEMIRTLIQDKIILKNREDQKDKGADDA